MAISKINLECLRYIQMGVFRDERLMKVSASFAHSLKHRDTDEFVNSSFGLCGYIHGLVVSRLAVHAKVSRPSGPDYHTEAEDHIAKTLD